MTTGSFPPDPSSRKVILVLSDLDIQKCGYEGDAEMLLDEEAYILQVPRAHAGGCSRCAAEPPGRRPSSAGRSTRPESL
jgi:hypothetical protein